MLEMKAALTAAGELESAAPQEVLEWAMQTFSERIALACSFGGPSGMVLLDMASRLGTIPVYYIDTDLLFPQTYEHIRIASRRYGIEFVAVRTELTLDAQAQLHGDALWETNPDLCCSIRKVKPHQAFLKQYDAWVSGIRRDQADTRTHTPVVAWDESTATVKVNPLATWSESQVWEYIHRHDVPYPELLLAGYRSIGCYPCTRATTAGLRDGRWPNFHKTECGLHNAPGRNAK